jgi:geranylgeranyl diphosphate synthase type II
MFTAQICKLSLILLCELAKCRSRSMGATEADLIGSLRARIESRLSGLIDHGEAPPRLLKSMSHSLLAPAKRVRAILTIITARELLGDEASALDFGCALEMVHAASLILDDLPCMDDAGFRRGLPSNHRVYGEATAILAAIGLMNRAYGVVAACDTTSLESRVAATDILYNAIGAGGLVGGQEEDLHDCKGYRNLSELERMYGRKTGALFAAAGELGAVAAARFNARRGLSRFGMELGIGFQILDDVLDAHGAAESAGKDVRQDDGRPNYVSLAGPAAAKMNAQAKIGQALKLAASLSAPGGPQGRLFTAFTAHLGKAFDALLFEPEARAAASG